MNINITKHIARLRIPPLAPLAPLAVVLFLAALSCDNDPDDRRSEALIYKHFREVPGITDTEISAIEALQAKNATFVYGMLLNNESFKAQNGEIRGYTALLCEYLTELFGMGFKPALYEWDDLIEGLADGSIDFTGELTASEERRKSHYMTDAIAERTIKTFRLVGAEPISQILSSRLPRYGFLEEVITSDMVSSFSEHEFESTFVPNHNVVYDALKSGRIDAFLEESSVEALFDEYDDIVSANFMPLIYSSVSLSTRNPELAPIISVVQKMLRDGHNKHLTGLYNQGYKEYAKSKLERSFSEEEREYIRQNPVVRLAAEFDNYPMSFYNKREHEWQGVVFDVLRKVEELTGLTFKVHNAPDADWSELIKMLEEGEVSMVSELIRTEEREGRFLWPYVAFMQDNYALISKSEYPDIEMNEILHAKVGLVKEAAHARAFNNWFQEHPNTVEFENPTEALDALKLGKIDLFMMNQSVILAMTNYMEQPGYKVNFLFSRSSYESSPGFNKDERVLCSIVDKALRQVEVEIISERWKHKIYDYRVKLAESRSIWFIGSSVLLLCVIALLLVLYKNKYREEKRMEALVQKRTEELNEQRKLFECMSLTDQLTGLPNRRSFDMRLDVEWRMAMRENQPISLLMLDIDHFKSVNDLHGHQAGDDILRIVADTIKVTLKRPGDFVARWGGEEFAVLLSRTDAAGAKKIAEAIRTSIENSSISLSGVDTSITISIGVNTQIPKHGDSGEDLISIADGELYTAKKGGRNRVCCAST